MFSRQLPSCFAVYPRFPKRACSMSLVPFAPSEVSEAATAALGAGSELVVLVFEEDVERSE